MQKIFVLLSIVSSVVLLVSFDFKKEFGRQQLQLSFQDSLDADRTKYIKQVMESIKGKENMRADSVFKNIKNLKMPAGRLVRIMEIAYSKSLGVSCGHCHNTNDFASEEKHQKDVTRHMAAMTNKINSELLKNIQGLQSTMAIINCTTCHRGEVKPALSLPAK